MESLRHSWLISGMCNSVFLGSYVLSLYAMVKSLWFKCQKKMEIKCSGKSRKASWKVTVLCWLQVCNWGGVISFILFADWKLQAYLRSCSWQGAGSPASQKINENPLDCDVCIHLFCSVIIIIISAQDFFWSVLAIYAEFLIEYCLCFTS